MDKLSKEELETLKTLLTRFRKYLAQSGEIDTYNYQTSRVQDVIEYVDSELVIACYHILN